MDRLMKKWGNNPAVPTGFDLDFILDLSDKEYEGLQAVFDRLCELEEKIEKGELTEVVRCKDCKHWVKCESSLLGEVMCCAGQGSAYIQKAADDFCSYGERREGE